MSRTAATTWGCVAIYLPGEAMLNSTPGEETGNLGTPDVHVSQPPRPMVRADEDCI